MSTLAPGGHLGPYEIVAAMDDGSETCKATDTRDNRTVAIRLVTNGWATSSEARKIAALNHTAIRATLAIEQQDGVSIAVMEYIEGQTLASRLTHGTMGLDETLKTAVALAGALDYAHSEGVVHQDVKPANVVLTKDGPRLSGFGLTAGDGDPRSDVFAFGALLYEMVAGKKAVAKASAEFEPLSSVTTVTSPMLEHVVMTCLARNPADRWQTARDLLAELEWISEHSTRTVLAIPVTARPRRRKLFRTSLVAAAFLTGLISAWAFVYARTSRSDEFQFLMDSVGGNSESFAISPDGQWVVYNVAAGNNTNTPLSVRRIGSITSQTLAGVETNQPDAAQNNATSIPKPFWSPDSRWIGFRQGTKLKKVQVSGGPPVDICDLSYFGGGTWNADGTIIFGSDKGLFRVSDQGGKPEPLTSFEGSERKHLWPFFLPDGRHYLYLAWTDEPSTRTIYAGVLGSKERTRIMTADSNFFYSPPGYLLFRRDRSLYSQAFNAQKLTISGDPVLITDNVSINGLVTGETLGNFSASQNGVLAYSYGLVVRAGAGGRDRQPRQLAWADRRGRLSETPGPEGAYRGVSVSPDGKRIAVHRHDGTGGDIWVIEPGGRAPTRITFDASRDNSMPVWSPDGSKIVYASQQKGKWGLYQNLSSGSGTEELLFESEVPKAPMSWIGRNIVFWVQDPKTSGDIWVLPLDGDKKPIPFANEPANETHPQLSPDGKWIAYTSNKTGNRNEIYVRPFPSGSGIWQVSTDGGDWPRWGHDGKELFYHAPNNITAFTDTEFSVAVSVVGSEFKAEQPEGLFRLPILNAPHPGGDYHTYDVSPDGQHFLYFQADPNDPGSTPPAAPAPASVQLSPEPTSGIVVALNWLSGLHK
jgi:Tol biopolymer transport system component